MTTLFKAPQIGEPRATGVKNGGVQSYDQRVIHPVSRIVDDAFTPGKQIEFRWRSDSSNYWNPRETKLAVKFKVMVAPVEVASDETEGALAACDRDNLPPNLRMTACPVACLFQDGARYEANSTVIENQPSYYDAAMTNLYTKFDGSSDTSGSCALVSRRKDMRDEQDQNGDDDERSGFAGLSENRNPKQEIIRAAHRNDPTAADSASASGEFEIAEPIWLSSMQHGYFVAGGDHQLTMTIGQHFATDLFYSCETNTLKTDRSGTAPNYTYATSVESHPAYTKVIAGVLPDPTKLTSKTVYVQITGVELHCAMAGPAVPTIPPSVSLKFSELQITTRPLTSDVVEESIVVPPSCRAIYLASRQNVHDIRCDREELGLAGAGIDEVGLIASGGNAAGNTETLPAFFTNLSVQLGSSIAPSAGGYSALDPTQVRMARPYNDALSVVGKPSAMRGCTWTYTDYCGRNSANGRRFPEAATGTLNGKTLKGEVFGDQGPMYMMRILTPPNSLSNVLSIRGNLSHTPLAGAKQQLVIICVHDELWNMQYAPPAELPISTTKQPIV